MRREWGRRSSGLLLLLGLCLVIFCFAPATEASQVKAVQSNVTSFSDEITILSSLSSAVDTGNSFILQSVEVDIMNIYGSKGRQEYGGEGTGMFTTYFEDTQTLNISRSRIDSNYVVTADVGDYVVEFTDAVKIFQGSATFTGTVYTRNVVLPETVDLNKSFPMYTVRGMVMQSDETETQFFKVTFPDANTLKLERLDLPTGTVYTPDPTMYVEWQVIELQTDATVKSGTVTLPYTDTSVTVDLSLTPISNIEKAFLVFNYTGAAAINGIDGYLLTRGTIDEATGNLVFTRAGTGGLLDQDVEIAWYLVELTDSSSLVQKGSANIPAAATSTTATLANSVDLTRAFPIISTSVSGTAVTNLSDGSVRAELTAANTLTFTRHTSAVACDVDWFVVEFAPLTLTSPNGGELWRVGETQNITWKHAAALETGGSQLDGTHSVDLLLSTDGGTTYPLTIVSGISAALDTYAWTIPATIDTTNLIGTQLKVRIVDTDLAVRNYDDSNGNFEIKGTISLVAPNGGEVWEVGNDFRNIVWDKTGDLSYTTFSIRLSEDGGATYETIVADLLDQATYCTGDSCSYNWNPIPDKIGSDRRIKVFIASDEAGVFDTSDADFYIKGTLKITSPIGAETWPAQTDQTITWNKEGTFATVSLYYSTNSGGTYPNTIATGVTAGTTSGSYIWTVPVEAISDFVRVKVVSDQATDLQVEDTSDADFQIVPSIEVTSPTTGTEVWRVGETHNITWIINGAIANVKIEYSTDGGATYPLGNEIVASTPAADLSYPWTIPDNISDTVKVKITNADNTSQFDESDNNFKIKGKIVVTSPDGGEVYTVGSSQVITWEKYGTIGDVDIKYSTDGGVTFPNTITATSVPASDLNYTWSPIPDTITDTARVKIELVSDPAGVFDVSDADFSIKGSLTLTAPNGGETFYVGDATDITWTYEGTIGNVELRYSTDGGATFPDTNVIVSGIAPTSSPYSWTIPDDISNTVRVQVLLVSDPTVNDISNADFSIKGSLTLTAPNGGETWEVGTYESITWTRLGSSLGTVKLEYSTNDGADGYPYSIATLIPSADLSYSWQIPDAIGNQLKVKITSEDDPATTDTSDLVFSIKGRFALSAPTGGETWLVGTDENISWASYGTIAKVNLYYSTDGGLTYPSTIVTATPNTDLYVWTIPDAIGTQVRVKVENFDDATVFDTSPGDFTIKGRIVVDTPNGGESWRVGETQSILWSAYGSIGNVEISYSTDGGTTYPNVITPVGGVPATDGSFAWTIPDDITTNAKIKIVSLTYSDVSDESDAVFSIKPSITVTAPNGGEAWVVGSTENITWTKTGTISTVKLEYSTNAFADELETVSIATAVDASLGTPYAWTIPDALSTTVKVRVTNEADTTVYDISDTNFKIVGSFTLTAPDGGETWTVGNSYSITWDLVGSIADAKLDYSTDSGASYPNAIVASTPAAGLSYSWTIPDDISNTVRVKISDASDATVFDASDADFSIIGGFDITAPDGGEVWTVGDSQNITWTTSGTVGDVKLEYSTNGFTDELETVVIVSSTINNNSYAWTIPDAISNTVKVRVSDATNANAYNISDGYFKIRGSITVTAPDGGEAWPINTTQDITWTKVGSIATVKLEYSTNGFADELETYLIASAVDATLGTPYSWLVPEPATISAKVRVTNEADSTVFDVSNNTFKIQGSFFLTAPDGGEVWIVGDTQNITWSMYGGIATAELRYSTDSGTTWPIGNIITSTVDASLGTYSWTIPDAIGTAVRVKITDANDTSVYDTSNADFTIKGSVTVVSPNGGETWIVGDTQNITWSRTGSFANVMLEYSTNGFLDELETVVIVASTPAADLSYAWTVADAIGTNLKVRISDSADSTVVDTSDSAFIIKGALSLTSPNGGETWIVDEVRNITWSRTGSIASVKLEYSIDSGVTYPNVIISSTDASTGSYSWTVPDAIGTTLRVRVTDASDATVFDTSDADFTIKPSLTVTSPNGGEVWTVNDTQSITWTKSGTINTVKLEYSTNGFTDELETVTIATAVDATTGTPYSWVIPDAISSSVKVRITNEADTTIYDISNSNFKIVGSLTITSPTAVDKWEVGQTYNIKWDTVGSIADVYLSYSIDGINYNPIITSTPAGGGSVGYPWTIPNTVSTNATVQIFDVTDASVGDISPVFSIIPKFVITAPALGDQLIANRTSDITWDAWGDNPTVDLYYSKDGFSSPGILITSGASNTGIYTWTVPDDLSDTVQVRVSYPDDATVYDDSDTFRITAGFTVTAPDTSADKWDVGTVQTIKWTCSSANVSFAKIEYSVDGGASYPYLITSTADNSGVAGAERTYSWTVPDTITDQFKVRISDANDSTAYDESDFNGKIKAYFEILNPNGDASGTQIFIVNDPYDITWTWNGTVSDVRLDYCKDDDWVNAVNIITSTPNDGIYEWTIPDYISDTVKVRVRDVNDIDARDESDNYFKIKGKFSVTTPATGDRLDIGYNSDLVWDTTGNITSVKIVAYSTLGISDPGFPYDESNPYVIEAAYTANVPNGTTTYTWTVPDMASDNVIVRVIDSNDSTVYADSAQFSIIGSFTITSPNTGSERWVVDSTENIVWTPTGSSITEARITYSTDGGATYNPIIENEGATANDGIVLNDGSFTWTIPDEISSQVLIKIEDPNDSTVYDISDNQFNIIGAFTITSPAGGERWVTNETHSISWDTTGSIGEVNLYYSKDDFTTDINTIVSGKLNVAGANSYGWTIPDDRSTTVKVRVEDASDSTVYTDSAAFTIDYYNITWDVRDMLTNLPIGGGLTVNCTSGWVATGLSSETPILHPTPYGAWSASWEHDDYGSRTKDYVADSDQSFTVYLESKVVHVWEAMTEYVYDPVNDKLSFSSTLTRDGSVVSGAQNCEIQIFNYDGLGNTKILTDNTPDANGFFQMEWLTTGLDTSRTYNALTVIENVVGGIFKTPFLINLKPFAQLQTVVDTVAQTEQTMTTKLDEQATLIQEKMDEQTQVIVGEGKTAEEVIAAGGMVGMVEEALTSFETQASEAITRLQAGADEAVAAGQQASEAAAELEATAKKYSWNATVSPNPALVGDMITLQCQGQAGLLPVLNVYSWDNQTIISGQVLTEVTPGLYIAEFVADDRFEPGKAYTYVVSESVTGGLVAGSGFVESMTITTVAGLAAAAPEAERAAKKALDAIQAVEAVLVSDEPINIGLTLKNLQESIEELPGIIAKEGPSAYITNVINEISDRLDVLIGEEGFDLSAMFEEALGESPTIKEIRKKTDNIEAIIRILQMLFEAKFGGIDTPIISTSLSPGSIIFKIVAVNPSKTKTQKIPVKIYLPQEVKAKDILDLGGMELEFDEKQSIYYVYKDEVELLPAQTRVFEVEVEDVWIIPEEKLLDLNRHTKSILEHLKDTEYYARASEIADSIYKRLDEIAVSQKDDTVSRKQHIGIYRTNLKVMDEVKEDIARLEKILATAGGPLAPEMLAKTKIKADEPSKTATWIVIFVIIIFIGLLAAVLFFTWHHQVKLTEDSLRQARRSAFSSPENQESSQPKD